MGWTEERVEMLTKLWNDGFSASQIAGRLGGVSRNAVIGKVHRLGLSGRGAPSKVAPTPRKTLAPQSVAASAPRPKPSERPAPKIATSGGVEKSAPKDKNGDMARVHLLDLQPGQCKWPVGDPTADDFGFCGGPREAGLPYCEAHAARAFTTSKRDEAKNAMARANQGAAKKAAAG